MPDVPSVGVNFACQQCFQPISLDGSFSQISEHALAELSVPISPPIDLSLDQQVNAQSSLDKYVAPFLRQSLAESDASSNAATSGFTFVDDVSLVPRSPTGTLGHKLRVAADLFDLVSANTEVDHPLCEECTDALLEHMDRQLRLVEDESNDYALYLQKLQSEKQTENCEELQAILDGYLQEKEQLIKELKTLQNAETKAELELKKQSEERDRIACEQERYYRELTRYMRELHLAEDELSSLKAQLNWSKAHLEHLQRTNVFNATFHIWHSGHFGTINNFRLGRLPGQPVDWSEINAAWGQAALLLTALARKMGFTFQKFEIVPYGNHSFVRVLGDNKELPLYVKGGIRFVLDTKFDQAVVAFLDCIQQFEVKVTSVDKNFFLPYTTDHKFRLCERNKESCYSVRLQFNSEEEWTKAMKFLLTDMKWGLAWLSTYLTQERMNSSVIHPPLTQE